MAAGELSGRRVLLTGASSGIGLATARLLAEEGARLALVARGEDGLARAVADARQRGAEAFALTADVSDRAAVDAAVSEAVRRLGGLDVAIVNAGAATYGPFEQLTPEEFDRVMAITFGGAVNTIRAVLPALRASAGTIVATGSAGGRDPLPLLTPYVAAKHALRGFVTSLRIELLAERARVAVCLVEPGPVNTPFWQHVTTRERHAPRRMLGAYRPEAVARALVACARRPRAEVSVGGAMALYGMIASVARPVTDRALALAMLWDRSGGEPPPEGLGGLWEATGDGTVEGGMGGRPSLAVEVRDVVGRVRRARRQPGGRGARRAGPAPGGPAGGVPPASAGVAPTAAPAAPRQR